MAPRRVQSWRLKLPTTPVAADVRPLHLVFRTVRADSPRRLRFGDSRHECFVRKILGPRVESGEIRRATATRGRVSPQRSLAGTGIAQYRRQSGKSGEQPTERKTCHCAGPWRGLSGMTADSLMSLRALQSDAPLLRLAARPTPMPPRLLDLGPFVKPNALCGIRSEATCSGPFLSSAEMRRLKQPFHFAPDRVSSRPATAHPYTPTHPPGRHARCRTGETLS